MIPTARWTTEPAEPLWRQWEVDWTSLKETLVNVIPGFVSETFFFFYCFHSFSLRNSCTVFCKSNEANERLLVERVSSTVSEGNGNSISWTGKSGFALEFNTPGKKESWFCVFLVYWVTIAQRTSMSFRKLVLRNGLKTFLRKRKQKTNGNNRWRIVSRLKKTS